MAEERLQKILARAGIASRRAAEQLMLAGQVTVNGQRADRLGMRADPDRDHIRVRGKLLRGQLDAPRRYYTAYKPRQMVTTLSDPEGRPSIADLLRARSVPAGVYPVGRLDWDAEGLLFLTNDGELANEVMHPRRHLPKGYLVKVKGAPGSAALEKLRRGVVLEAGERTLPAEVRLEEAGEGASWLSVTLREGRKNQLKKMFERVGHPVRRIRRLSIGPLRLGRMHPGDVRPLTDDDLRRLRRALADESWEAPQGPRRARPRADAERARPRAGAGRERPRRPAARRRDRPGERGTRSGASPRGARRRPRT